MWEGKCPLGTEEPMNPHANFTMNVGIRGFNLVYLCAHSLP